MRYSIEMAVPCQMLSMKAFRRYFLPLLKRKRQRMLANMTSTSKSVDGRDKKGEKLTRRKMALEHLRKWDKNLK